MLFKKKKKIFLSISNISINLLSVSTTSVMHIFLAFRGIACFSQILESTMRLKSEMTSETASRIISDFLTEQKGEKAKFKEVVNSVQLQVSELGADSS